MAKITMDSLIGKVSPRGLARSVARSRMKLMGFRHANRNLSENWKQFSIPVEQLKEVKKRYDELTKEEKEA